MRKIVAMAVICLTAASGLTSAYAAQLADDEAGLRIRLKNELRRADNEIISKIGADAVALPENFRIHDLEKFNLNRFRFRGALSTASIDDFTRYSKDLADEGTRCFIDADNMRAVSVLNLGTI
ncbi:DUF2303 family protein, partial [Escherichia coli]|uniref:DUF2303 family protein n=1 Tax=Escherichia coli TaxID=562 RepID=UPI0020306A92